MTQDKRILSGAPGRTSSASLVLDSAVSSTFAGPSNNDSIIRGNATQMKRALSEASSRTVAGGAQKKAKGDMDPVGIPLAANTLPQDSSDVKKLDLTVRNVSDDPTSQSKNGSAD